jgi:curved DNA-binding protein CbpA
MKNPYEVLGIPPQAGEERLREAYRDLARECEGDRLRTQELNDAYDSIVLSRGQYAGRSGRIHDAADLSDIRIRIQAGRFDDALMLLDGVPVGRRGAEWYYLKGCAQRGCGWLEEAEKNFAQAARLAPGNREYQAAWEQMRDDRREGDGPREDGRDGDCLRACAGLACLNCLCDCLR